ncbi:hypothetical protein A1OW_16015 [Enterovibrio norvegicus]|nr:hypothetical protein A1OW_16015 [Enterovibrio norvegicus]OEF53308.1 hypothetical protein A1OU_02325 [Enterovibrio norvegicus]
MKNVMSHKISTGVSLPITIISASIFLLPGLLLWTPNFSVGVGLLIVIYSLYYCARNRSNLTLNKYDLLVLAIFTSYLLANIPITIMDESNLRYIDAPSRILLFFPVYLMFKRELPNLNARFHLEHGVIIGAIGAFIISIYQYYILGLPRVDGFLFSINFGYLSCSLALMNLCLIKNSDRKKLLILGFLCASIATTLTLTRGAIFAIPLLLLLLGWVYRKEVNNRILILSVSSFVFASVLLYFSSPGVQERVDFTTSEFSSILSGNIAESSSSGGRLQLWYASTEAFTKRPLIGLTHSEREALNIELFESGAVTEWVTSVSRGHAHSQYFEMLASNGILSIITIIFLFGITIYLMSKNMSSIFSVAGIIFISGIAIFGLTEVLLQANIINVYFGFFLAFFLASSLYGTKEQRGLLPPEQSS